MSKLADEIDREYKIRKAYKEVKRQKCKTKECKDCRYKNICIDKEEQNSIK